MTEATTSELVVIPFHDVQIVATRDQRIALKPVCDAIGLDESGQRQRLQRQPWATAGMTPAVAEDGKVREMFTMDRRTFTMWLATIDASRLKSEDARRQVALFQNEAADVLDAYFHQGGSAPAQAPETPELLMARALMAAADTIKAADRKIAQLELEVEHAGPAVRYFDKFICDSDALRLDDWGKQHGLTGHAAYDLLVDKGAIFKRLIMERWSNKKQEKVKEWEYRQRAGWQAFFDLRPQHNAPRHHNGQVRQTLYVKAGMSVELAEKVGLAHQAALAVEGGAA